jgi:hypothetical protein
MNARAALRRRHSSVSLTNGGARAARAQQRMGVKRIRTKKRIIGVEVRGITLSGNS